MGYFIDVPNDSSDVAPLEQAIAYQDTSPVDHLVVDTGYDHSGLSKMRVTVHYKDGSKFVDSFGNLVNVKHFIHQFPDWTPYKWFGHDLVIVEGHARRARGEQ